MTHLSGVVASLGSGTGYSSGARASALEGCFMDLLVGGTHMVRAARGGLPDARAGAGLAEALPGRVCAAAGRHYAIARRTRVCFFPRTKC